MNVAFYARVSSENQAQAGTIESQIELQSNVVYGTNSLGGNSFIH